MEDLTLMVKNAVTDNDKEKLFQGDVAIISTEGLSPFPTGGSGATGAADAIHSANKSLILSGKNVSKGISATCLPSLFKIGIL